MATKPTKAPEPAAPQLARPRSAGAPDPRAGETASQDIAPTADDIRLEALQSSHSPEAPGIDDWRDANARFLPGLEYEREEAPVVRGPENPDGRGRVVLEGEEVTDREADADATDEDPDGVAGDDA
jgi:hypothetical protein